MSKVISFGKLRVSSVKHELTQHVADVILGEKSHFSQVVLRRDHVYKKANVPFFAYTVEKDGFVVFLFAEKGAPGGVYAVRGCDIRSVSDGKTKIAKMHIGR